MSNRCAHCITLSLIEQYLAFISWALSVKVFRTEATFSSLKTLKKVNDSLTHSAKARFKDGIQVQWPVNILFGKIWHNCFCSPVLKHTLFLYIPKKKSYHLSFSLDWMWNPWRQDCFLFFFCCNPSIYIGCKVIQHNISVSLTSVHFGTAYPVCIVRINETSFSSLHQRKQEYTSVAPQTVSSSSSPLSPCRWPRSLLWARLQGCRRNSHVNRPLALNRLGGRKMKPVMITLHNKQATSTHVLQSPF